MSPCPWLPRVGALPSERWNTLREQLAQVPPLQVGKEGAHQGPSSQLCLNQPHFQAEASCQVRRYSGQCPLYAYSSETRSVLQYHLGDFHKTHTDRVETVACFYCLTSFLFPVYISHQAKDQSLEIMVNSKCIATGEGRLMMITFL